MRGLIVVGILVGRNFILYYKIMETFISFYHFTAPFKLENLIKPSLQKGPYIVNINFHPPRSRRLILV